MKNFNVNAAICAAVEVGVDRADAEILVNDFHNNLPDDFLCDTCGCELEDFTEDTMCKKCGIEYDRNLLKLFGKIDDLSDRQVQAIARVSINGAFLRRYIMRMETNEYHIPELIEIAKEKQNNENNI